MPTRIALVILLAATLAISANVPAGNDPPVEFSAETFETSQQGGTVRGKIYASAQGMRREQQYDQQRVIEILNRKQGKAWVLFPAERTYIEQQRPPGSELPAVAGGGRPTINPCQGAPEGVRCRKLGTEVIDGRQTQRWEIVTEQQGRTMRTEQWIDVERGMPIKQDFPGGSSELRLVGEEQVNGRETEKWELIQQTAQGQTYRTVQWYDPVLEMTVREEMPGGYRRELRNIRIGPQPASLFELPEGYRPKPAQKRGEPGQGPRGGYPGYGPADEGQPSYPDR